MLKNKRDQSINEYAMLIVLIVLAGVGMQNYLQLGVQSVVKLTADNLASGGRLESTAVTPADAAIALQYGVREIGLNNLTMISPIEVHTDRKITVNTGTKREKIINQDETKVSGKWSTTYTLNSAAIYGSLEKQKSSASAANSQPVVNSQQAVSVPKQ